MLPLGTVNVFARELKIPLRIECAWDVLQRGREMRIDLPRVEFSANGSRQQRYFVQLAGAGFDARAIELVDWEHKKKIGPLAYVIAGVKALREPKPKIIVRAGGREVAGELVLIGNGRLYGGPIGHFPGGRFARRIAGNLRFPARQLAGCSALPAGLCRAATIAGELGAACSRGGF